MSVEDLEAIREAVAALNRGDVDGIAARLAPDVELVPLRAVLDGSVYRGHEGLRRWLADMSEDWVGFEIRLDELRELGGGRVLVQGTMSMQGRSSGVAVDAPAAWLCDMHAGRVRRIRFFADSGAAATAAEQG